MTFSKNKINVKRRKLKSTIPNSWYYEKIMYLTDKILHQNRKTQIIQENSFSLKQYTKI